MVGVSCVCARVRRLVVCVLPLWLACDGGTGLFGDPGGVADVGGGADAGASDYDFSVPAGPAAAAVGIGSYGDFVTLPGEEPTVSFSIESTEGAHFGTATMVFGVDGELRVSFASHSGESAAYRSSAIHDAPSGELTVREVFEAQDRTVEILRSGNSSAIAGQLAADPPAWPDTVVLRAHLPAGVPAPRIGGYSPDGGLGGSSALVVVREGGRAAAEAEVSAWVDANGLTQLTGDPTVARLAAAMRDSALLGGLESVLGARGFVPQTPGQAPGTVTQPLHVSDVCGLVSEIIAADTRSLRSRCCNLCMEATTGDGFSFLGWGGILACDCCSTTIGLGLSHLYRCVRAHQDTASHWTDQRCQAERPAPGGGLILLATEDGHGCERHCEAASCEAACQAYLSPMGVPGTSMCLPSLCVCQADPEAACLARNPADYCGSGWVSRGVLTCPTAACGDGRWTTPCDANPLLSETCDASSPNPSCPAGETCTADCLLCEPCECTPGTEPSGCAANEECTSRCRCQVVPSGCAGRQREVGPRWCDPDRGGGTCPAGTVCDAGSCECTYCGDLTVNGSEECEPGVAGAECSGERSCEDCRCVPNCGNGRVDPGEHCDPAALPTCEAGYACESCACVLRDAVCGDGLCDRQGGESERSCAGDCPVVCGDGVCNATAGETPGNCAGDCPTTAVQCCVDTDGCPSEELYSCPGDCCCCPSGAHCVRPLGVWVCGI